MGSAHGDGSRPAWLAVPSACCGSRPAEHLWLQPGVRGYPKTLLRGEIQQEEEPPRHTHTGKAQGWGCRGDWPENTQKSCGREEAAPCSSALVVAGLLGPEQDPGTGSNVCAGSEAKAELVVTVTGEGGPRAAGLGASRCCTCRRGQGSWAANRHSWGTAGFRRGVPGRSERAERSPGEN